MHLTILGAKQAKEEGSPYDDRCNGGEILSGTYDLITARTVSVEMHLSIPCSSAKDIPKVLFPVPGPPLIRISFGGSFVFLTGGGELNVRRCFMEADNAVVGLCCATLLLLE